MTQILKFRLLLLLLLLMPIGCAMVADRIIQKYDIAVVNTTEHRINGVVVRISSRLFPVGTVQPRSASRLKDITTPPSSQVTVQWHDVDGLLYKKTLSVSDDFIWDFNGRSVIFTIVPGNNALIKYTKEYGKGGAQN